MSATGTLIGRITETLRRRGAAPALIDGRSPALTFAELDRRSAAFAAILRHLGVTPGQPVAVALENGADLVCASLGVLRAGAVLLPACPSWTNSEFDHVLGDSGARAIVATASVARALRARRPRVPVLSPPFAARRPGLPDASLAPPDPALLVYTSGTTGRPKGALLSHGALLANLSAVARTWQWSERDRLLLTLPCFHLHGLGLGVLTSLLVGSEIVLQRRFVAEEVIPALARHRCTMFFGVPTMYNRLVLLPEGHERGHDLATMRLWVSGSAPLTESTFERFRQRFGYALMNRYGMTECGFVLSTRCDEPRRPGVVGKPLPETEVRIVDPDRADAGEIVDVAAGEPGELLVRGPGLFSGYWRRPGETARAFLGPYLRTGDLGIREGDGNVRIAGRRSVDMIKSGGFRIGAVEIEECLQAHPGVAEAAVVGVPDADRGQVVVAVVTPRPGAHLTEDEVRAHASRHLARYKVPTRVVFLAEIPRSGPGKFRKAELVRMLRETSACAS